MSMKRVACVTPLLVCLFACGEGTAGSGETGLTLTGAETSGDGDGDPGDGDGDTSEPFEPIPARGLTITKVTANHGINVSVANVLSSCLESYSLVTTRKFTPKASS